MKMLLRIILCGVIPIGLWTSPVWGHVFPRHSHPKVGETLSVSPERVSIWFDGPLERVFCTLRVLDENGRRVDKNDAHVDGSDPSLVEVSLPSLSSGTYKVIWSVVSRDGHRTQGDYPFGVK